MKIQYLYHSLIVAIFVSANAFAAEAPTAQSLEVQYQQTSNFWTIYGELNSDINSAKQANKLFNELYGAPEADQISFRYLAPSEIVRYQFSMDQIGYVYARNPILPKLFAWAGAGPSLTVGYKFLEVYGTTAWAKRVDSVSSDLIDKKLVANESVQAVGVGLNFSTDFLQDFPSKFTLFTRHTYFTSDKTGNQFLSRWRTELESNFSPLMDVKSIEIRSLIIAGPQPVPGFQNSSRLWDYLWKVDPASEALSMIGGGIKLVLPTASRLSTTAGFFGGYLGGEFSFQTSKAIKISAQSYGIETSTLYQTQAVRMWGMSFNYLL